MSDNNDQATVTETDAVDSAEAAVAEAQASFDRAQTAVAEAQKNLLEAQDALDGAIAARDGPPNPHQDQIDRMLYIKSQAEQRAARHGIAMKLREGSPDPAVLDPRSILDKAMARNTKRGQQRPKARGND